MAAAAHQRHKPEKPAGGRAASTPGRFGQGTMRGHAGPQLHLPHCCWTAGGADGWGEGRCVNAGAINMGQYKTKADEIYSFTAHLLHKINLVMSK